MKVKICGITHPKDAENAALNQADYIGVNFSKISKRYVSPVDANEIVIASKLNGAEPVGVFVDETIEEINEICDRLRLKTIQLHGFEAQKHFDLLRKRFTIFFGISVNNHCIQQSFFVPNNVYPLFDYPGGGSGKTFNWETFFPPLGIPWILAGGLCPNNVRHAIDLLKPYAVDVASGVEVSGSNRKDIQLVKEFIRNAKEGISI